MYIFYGEIIQKITSFGSKNNQFFVSGDKNDLKLDDRREGCPSRPTHVGNDVFSSSNMFPASWAPMAPPIIRCYDFSRADGHPPWVAEILPNHGFSRIFKNLHWFLVNFDEHMVQCAPTQHPSSCEARVWRPSVSVSRFPERMHVLDSLGPIPNRLNDFYFSTKIKIFENFLKILENPWFERISATHGGCPSALEKS